jgi:hypothetical protein
MSEGQKRARTNRPKNPPNNWTLRDADAAVTALKEALNQVNITLPSVDRAYGALSNPLVDLGRARPDVVMELASCLTELVELREAEKGAVAADG